MSTVAAHLRKEYRDHRSGLIGLSLVILAAGLVLCLALDEYWIEQSLVSKLTLGTLIGAIVLFAPDLSEQRSKTLGFVSRVPHGLQVAFWAKAIFLLATISGLTLGAFGTAIVLRALFVGIDWYQPMLRLDGSILSFAWQTLAAAFWLLAASFWLGRSTVCVPTVALLLFTLGLPAYFIAESMSPASPWPIEPFCYLHPLVALYAAWLSCVRGRRSGRGAGASAWRGLTVALVASAALTGASYQAYQDWYWYDPRSESLTIRNAVVDPSGRRAYLSVSSSHGSSDRSMRAVVLDLHSGRLTEFGGAPRLAKFFPLTQREYGHWPTSGDPSLLLCMSYSDDFRPRLRLLDTTTQRVLGELPLPIDELRYDGFESLCRDALRSRSGLRLPDGRHCWSAHGAILTDDGEGTRTLLEPAEAAGLSALSFHRGFALADQGLPMPRRVYDLTRERFVTLPDRGWCDLRVLIHHWVVATPQRHPETHRTFNTWQVFDPDLGSLRPADGMVAGDRVLRVLGDGRLLVAHSPPDPRQRHRDAAVLFRVDTASGERQALSVADLPNYRLPSLAPGITVLRVTPGGRVLAIINRLLTSLAADSSTFSRGLQFGVQSLASIESETSVIAIVYPGQLVRINLETGLCSKLFPRDVKSDLTHGRQP